MIIVTLFSSSSSRVSVTNVEKIMEKSLALMSMSLHYSYLFHVHYPDILLHLIGKNPVFDKSLNILPAFLVLREAFCLWVNNVVISVGLGKIRDLICVAIQNPICATMYH